MVGISALFLTARFLVICTSPHLVKASYWIDFEASSFQGQLKSPVKLPSSWPMLSCTARIVRPYGLVWKGMSLGRWMRSVPPAWWAKGWPRERVDSMAEAELLSQLAVALKPRTKIGELFRRFPAPEGWGGKYLDPDLAVHGVLKRNGALFVEYDGYWRHSEGERLSTDRRKNAALLSHVPASSRIVRIGHWEQSPTEAHPRILWITVDQWRAGSQKSISKVLKKILLQILTEFGGCLQPHVAKRLEKLAQLELVPASTRALDFTSAAASSVGGTTKEELFRILTRRGFTCSSIKLLMENSRLLNFSSERQVMPGVNLLIDLGLSDDKIAKALSCYPQILGLSVESNLQPTVHFLLDLGLTKSQVAKVVAGYPQTLACSIEQNLKPTVHFFLDLGLTKSQVAKAVDTFPRILAYSTEQNLKPTVQWFLDLGLTKSQVAKAVACHPPVLWLSIEQNLQPTVQWFLDLGLSKIDVAKVVASSPRTLGFSIQGNLSHKVSMLNTFFSPEFTTALIRKSPQILGYRFHRLSSRLSILAERNETHRILYALALPDAVFQRRFLNRIDLSPATKKFGSGFRVWWIPNQNMSASHGVWIWKSLYLEGKHLSQSGSKLLRFSIGTFLYVTVFGKPDVHWPISGSHIFSMHGMLNVIDLPPYTTIYFENGSNMSFLYHVYTEPVKPLKGKMFKSELFPCSDGLNFNPPKTVGILFSRRHLRSKVSQLLKLAQTSLVLMFPFPLVTAFQPSSGNQNQKHVS